MVILLVAFSVSTVTAQEPARVALLIGNKDYKPNVGPLVNTHNDVDTVGAALRQLGFNVTIEKDAGYRDMDVAIRRHVARVQTAGAGAISFFYYSGHGVANAETNSNYLIPVDVARADTDDIWFYSFEQSAVIDRLNRQAPQARHLIVFDACRDELNLTRSGSKALGVTKGFVPVNDVRGMLIAYATADRRTAADTGTFAKILAEEIVKPGVETVSVFRRVQLRAASEMKQEPWMSLHYLPETYLAAKNATAEAGGTSAGVCTPEQARRAEEFWLKVERFNRAEYFRELIRLYPNCVHAEVAAVRLSELEERQKLAVGISETPSPPAGKAACEGVEVSLSPNGSQCVRPGSGETFRDCWTESGKTVCGPQMAVLPTGQYLRGSPDDEEGRYSTEGPRREVTIANPLAVGRTHVTRGEFEAFVKATGHKAEGGCRTWTGFEFKVEKGRDWRSPGFDQTEDHPVVCVNWEDASAYAKWVSDWTAKNYRLMSETEAEYAARGTTVIDQRQPRYFFGNEKKDLCSYANGPDQTAQEKPFNWPFAACKDGYVYTAPAARFKANAFGLHDVHGNVSSWTKDCWHETYEGAPSDGSARESGDCSLRVLRGGSWFSDPRFLRAAYRGRDGPDYRDDDVGFRLARTLNP